MAYDVLVVGGGTSGSVLAARLSEDPGRRVLLLEEGADHSTYDATVTAPTFGQHASLSRRFAQGLMLDMDGQGVPLARGRVLGGTSAVNYLATVRGCPADYDSWGAGWTWADVLPVFRRVEHDLDLPDSPLHGDTGPLTVRRWSEATFAPAHATFLHGLAEVGVATANDINDPAQLPGVGAFPASVSDGERLTVSRAYLTEEVRARPNLEIRTGVRVRSVAVERGRAMGVHLDEGIVEAGEVLVCAGAVETPALLLRSGIGAADELAALGIPVVCDLPDVGRHLQDHLGSAVGYRIAEPGVGSGSPAQTVWVAGRERGGASNTHVFPVLLPGSDGRAIDGAFALLIFSMRPEASGSVTLRSDRPDGRPTIRVPRPGKGEYDAHREAVAVLREWEHSPAARAAGLSRASETAASLDNDAQSLWLRQPASYAHLTSTCAMGRVLDRSCRVLGLDGLRVVDASAMPRIPSGNTYLTCVMLAERVADLIDEDR